MAGSPSSSQPVTFTTAGYRLPAADPAGGGDARTGLPVAAGMLAIADTPTDRRVWMPAEVVGIRKPGHAELPFQSGCLADGYRGSPHTRPVDGGYSDSRTRARSANARRASVELGAKRSKPWGAPGRTCSSTGMPAAANCWA